MVFVLLLPGHNPSSTDCQAQLCWGKLDQLYTLWSIFSQPGFLPQPCTSPTLMDVFSTCSIPSAGEMLESRDTSARLPLSKPCLPLNSAQSSAQHHTGLVLASVRSCTLMPRAWETWGSVPMHQQYHSATSAPVPAMTACQAAGCQHRLTKPSGPPCLFTCACLKLGGKKEKGKRGKNRRK